MKTVIYTRETVTYIEAGKLLNKAHQSIKSSVDTKTLTKCMPDGKRACLLKGQVLLFKDKSRVSLKDLNEQELEIWERYRDIAEEMQGREVPQGTPFSRKISPIKKWKEIYKHSLKGNILEPMAYS